MRALVLSGGGARGAYEVGVYHALSEAGLAPDIVSGTSVGAIGAAFIAQGSSVEEMEDVWRNLAREDVYRVRRDLWRVHQWTHLLDTGPLRELLEERLDMEAVRSSDTTILVTATEVTTGDQRVFTNADLTIDHLLASAAIPFLFPMVSIADETFWDGGLVGYTPVRPAVDAGATEVWAVLTDAATPAHGHVPSNLAETWDRAFDVMATAHLRKDLREVAARNGGTPVDVHVISPDESLQAGLLTFEPDVARDLMERGREDGRAHLEDNGAPHGARSPALRPPAEAGEGS